MTDTITVAPRGPVVVSIVPPVEEVTSNSISVLPSSPVAVGVQSTVTSVSTSSPQTVELVISESASPPGVNTQTLTDMTTTPGAVYVGIADSGELTSAPVWRIFKVVEADSHPLKVPPTGRAYDNIWDNRDILVYQNG